MTAYKRKHRVCEWGYCDNKKSMNVHHILPVFKYPEFKDGTYHGKKDSNFISYCPFHHFAYHYVYSSKRNNFKHGNSANLLWSRIEIWAEINKISMEDIEIEISQMM